MELEVFSSYVSQCFLDDLDESRDPMLSMYDIVSWTECYEEIEILREGFLRTSPDKYLRNDIICYN